MRKIFVSPNLQKQITRLKGTSTKEYLEILAAIKRLSEYDNVSSISRVLEKLDEEKIYRYNINNSGLRLIFTISSDDNSINFLDLIHRNDYQSFFKKILAK